MMFRRVDNDEEESGSDWDDYTPRQSPTHQAPPSPSPSPSPTPATTTANNPPGAADLFLPAQNKYTDTIAGVTSNSPPLLAHSSVTLNRADDRSSNYQSKGRSTHVTQHTTSSGDRAPNYRSEGCSTQPIQREMTSIRSAPTPHPPPPKIPPSAKSVYRVREGEGEEQVEAGLRECVREGAGSPSTDLPSRGSRGDVKLQHEENYRLDLEFTNVSGQGVEYLAPSNTPPYAFMRGVSIKWERMSQRCVEEFFSSLRLISDFMIIFTLGLANCLLNHVLRKLCCGLGHILADSIYKPGVTLLFNGFMWPILSLWVQLSKGVVLVMGPLLEVVGVLMSWVVQVARACRLVTISNKTLKTEQV